MVPFSYLSLQSVPKPGGEPNRVLFMQFRMFEIRDLQDAKIRGQSFFDEKTA